MSRKNPGDYVFSKSGKDIKRLTSLRKLSSIRINVLRCLKKSPSYGYQISKDLNAKNADTIYNALKFFADLGVVESYEERDSKYPNRIRIIFKLTSKGNRYAEHKILDQEAEEALEKELRKVPQDE